jgi:hypothetical protein
VPPASGPVPAPSSLAATAPVPAPSNPEMMRSTPVGYPPPVAPAMPAPAPTAAPPPLYPPPPTDSAPSAYPPPPAGPPSFGGDPAFMSGFGAPPGPDSVSIGALKGASPGALLVTSAKRAVRLQIDPADVLPAERAALEAAEPPITDRNLQAFMTWRRSILLAVVALTGVLAIIRFADALRGPTAPAMMRMVGVVPALAQAFVCGWCVLQLKQWTKWNAAQRKALAFGAAVLVLAPFVVYLYPVRMSIEGVLHRDTGEEVLLFSLITAMQATLALAPMALSLVPGLVRAALTTKLLFPGAAAPGWVIALATPISALFAFAVMLVPYQVSGSGWFLLAMLGVIAAQVVLARAALPMMRPSTEAAAALELRKIRTIYLAAHGVIALCLILAIQSLARSFGSADQVASYLGFADTVTVLLSVGATVLLLTLVGTDHAIAGLDRARAYAALGAKDVEEAQHKVAVYAGSEPPPPPPPAPPDAPPPFA